MYASNESANSIAKTLGVSRATVYRVLSDGGIEASGYGLANGGGVSAAMADVVAVDML